MNDAGDAEVQPTVLPTRTLAVVAACMGLVLLGVAVDLWRARAAGPVPEVTGDGEDDG